MFGVRGSLTLAWGLWFHFWLILDTMIFGSLAFLSTFIDPHGNLAKHCVRWWGKILLCLAHIPVQVQGLEYLSADQAYVFAVNHRSNFDIYVLSAVLPGKILWVAKKSLFAIPIFGQALSRMGSVPVDRSNLQEAIRSLNRATQMVRGGTSMIIFPEGTRGTTKELLPFKKGVFIMALKAGQPIVPVSINGTFFIQPRGSLRVRPGPIKVVIAPPIRPQAFRRKEELMEAVRQAIVRDYDPDFPYGPGGGNG
jgi:1-acyl-sn-glycerol-3-phosphate acyltransferase